jgi:hypothetical protein
MAVSKNTGTMKSVSFGAEKLDGLEVVWSHISKPDLEYQSGHSVTVKTNKALKEYVKQLKAQSGIDKVNGMKKTEDGEELMKFGTKIYSSDGVERFPNVYDLEGQKTNEVPFREDVVNLVVKPKIVEFQNKTSISVYLNEVQMAQSSGGGGVTFAKPKPKQEEVSFEKEQTSEEDLPF